MNNMTTIRPKEPMSDMGTSTIRPTDDNVTNALQTIVPQSGDYAAKQSTQRPQIKNSDTSITTVRPGENAPVTLNESTVSVKKNIDAKIYQQRNSYTINGIEYTVIKALSLTSGEAQVFLVESPTHTQHVLKLYYKDCKPNPKILDKVTSTNSAFHSLVEINSHGAFEERYFELMHYYEGGNLESIDVRRKEDVINKLIRSMAISIDLCHELGFIHRDIKPSNFIFDDKDKTDLLLGDFGIAIECRKGEQCVSDMAKTKIFAAPEVYINIGDGKPILSAKSDFYSLGITILYLWMGKDEFAHFEKENELQLANMKAFGTLPIPNSMPSRLYSLIKALIEPNPSRRAGFEEIEKWLNGENPFEEIYNNDTSDFNVIFDGERNLIAYSPKELANIMKNNSQLAIRYLYKGRITSWLEDNRRPELAVEMDRIKEDLYPQNTTAGLDAACYVLNPEMPFVDICGNDCRTSPEISQSILTNFNSYLSTLSENKDCRLTIFLQTHGLVNAVRDFRQEFTNNQRLGLLYLAYRLDANQPWRMTDTDGNKFSFSTGDEILNWVSHNSASDQSLSDIVSNAFFIWIRNRDANATKAIAPLMCHQGDKEYGVGVLYRLNLNVGLYFILDQSSPSYISEIPQLGKLINRCLMSCLNESDKDGHCKRILKELSDIQKGERTSIYHFLESKGYKEKIDWIKYCLELNSVDNTKKAGPYSKIIGMFKLVKGMVDDKEFFFTFKSGKTITDPSQLPTVSTMDLQDAMNNKDHSLESWIAVFYQEDPYLDKSETYTYEKRTSEYLKFLSEHGFDTPEIKRYSEAKKTVESRAKKLRNTLSSIKKGRIIIAIVSLLPLGIAALLLAFLWHPDFGTIKFEDVFTPIAVILTIIICITDGFAGRIIGEAVWGCLIAAIISFIFVHISGFLLTITPYIAAAAIACIGVYIYCKCIGVDLKENGNKELLYPEFEHLELEPLYEAYHPNTKGFDSSIGDKTSSYQKLLSQIKKTMWIKALPIGLITIVCIFYFVFMASPSSSKEYTGYNEWKSIENKPMTPNFERGLSGSWVGWIKGDNMQVKIEPTSSANIFKMKASDNNSKETSMILTGKFVSEKGELIMNNCEISDESGISLKVKVIGTLKLIGDKISGEIKFKNSKNNSVESATIPIDIQYVSE